jgi:hypothetical protein
MVAFVVFVAAAILLASRMGETSHAYARGSVVLPDELREQAKGARTLFVIALGPDRPMPLGAMRHALGDDLSGTVYEFVMTAESMRAMGEGMEWPETFKLKARLDRDGQGGADQPGDLVGEVLDVKKGQKDVEIRIDRVIQ